MKKIVFGDMCPTRTSQLPGGQVRQKHGGSWQLRIIIGWEDSYGRALITAANLLRSVGLILIRILASWICVGSPKIFITIIKAGGLIKMYCISLLIGTGKEK